MVLGRLFFNELLPKQVGRRSNTCKECFARPLRVAWMVAVLVVFGHGLLVALPGAFHVLATFLGPRVFLPKCFFVFQGLVGFLVQRETQAAFKLGPLVVLQGQIILRENQRANMPRMFLGKSQNIFCVLFLHHGFSVHHSVVAGMPKFIRECGNRLIECPRQRYVRKDGTYCKFQYAGPTIAFGQNQVQADCCNGFAKHLGPFKLLGRYSGILEQMKKMLVVYPFNE